MSFDVLWLLKTSWQAGILAAIILLLRAALGNRLTPAWRYRLWLLVVLRLLLPDLPASRFSVNEAVPFPVTAPLPVAAPVTPQVTPKESVATATMKPRWSWMQWTTLVWAVGAAGFAGAAAFSYLRFRRSLRGARIVNEGELLELAREAAGEMGCRRLPVIVETPCVTTPALFGLLRPRLLLLERMTASREELRLIFLHEFAHLRRFDVTLNTVVTGLQIAHWFNPLLWLAFRAMRHDRELATDALALAHRNAADRRLYGETLLRLVEGAEPGARPVVGMIDTSRHLKERLLHIVRVTPPGKKGVLIGGALILLLSLTALTREAAESPTPPTESPGAAAQLAAGTAQVAGFKLTEKQADALEAEIAKAPDAPENIVNRQKLIAYSMMHRRAGGKAMARRSELILWMIRHRPADPFSGLPPMGPDKVLEPQLYADAAKAWEEQLKAHPKNTNILMNAARFYLTKDSPRAMKLLEEGLALEPENVELLTLMARLADIQSMATPAGDEQIRAAAPTRLKLWERVAKKSSPERRMIYLSNLALAALDAGENARAKAYAEEMLESAPLQAAPTHPAHWNQGNAIYTGHSVLGQLALRAGDIEGAKRELLLAARTPGSPQLDSFGPDCTLASQLSELGETEAVLAFLKEIERFWEGNRGRTDTLRELAREKKPFPRGGKSMAPVLPKAVKQGE